MIILSAVRAGATFRAAAIASGVGVGTFSRWMLKGRDQSDNPAYDAYRAFREDVLAAQAQGELLLVATWQRAAQTDWRAARDLLSARHRWDAYRPVVPDIDIDTDDVVEEDGALVIEQPGQLGVVISDTEGLMHARALRDAIARRSPVVIEADVIDADD